MDDDVACCQVFDYVWHSGRILDTSFRVGTEKECN